MGIHSQTMYGPDLCAACGKDPAHLETPLSIAKQRAARILQRCSQRGAWLSSVVAVGDWPPTQTCRLPRRCSETVGYGCVCNQTLNDKHMKQNGKGPGPPDLPLSTGSPQSEARQSLGEITNVSNKKGMNRQQPVRRHTVAAYRPAVFSSRHGRSHPMMQGICSGICHPHPTKLRSAEKAPIDLHRTAKAVGQSKQTQQCHQPLHAA
jgi:hypothetical protein